MPWAGGRIPCGPESGDRLTAGTGRSRGASALEWGAGCVRAQNVGDRDLGFGLGTDEGVDEPAPATGEIGLEWQLRGRKEATLVEVLPRPDEVWAEGPGGRYTHSAAVARPRVRRRFPPGSPWLYAKLYCGPATADRVLEQVVRPLVDQALKTGAADSWFFVRYGDPDWHVRLRLHGEPYGLTRHVLPHLEQACSPLLTDGRVWRLQLAAPAS
ncbi:thiopeptide-type bacteriocin biosynthesis protein [Streptomyces sp. NPDC004787]|uniref:thiopeptide-type bacteriocin biosynthesis protein n=1 Tax=Streptomyces sp. NPDC004787 TaxID=3154291 RepID=UPI0033AEC758